MINVLREIDSLIEFLEAKKLPASINANRKLEDKFRQDMEAYFQKLEKSFPYHKLAELPVQEVSPPKPIFNDGFLDDLLKAFTAELLYGVNSHMVAIYIVGSIQTMHYGATKMGIPITYEGPPMEQAVKWAEKHCAEMVTKMEEETKARLAKVISDSIENKDNLDQLSRQIKKEFADMTKTRADMIAQTETNAALSKGSIDRMHTMGIDGKEWVCVDDPCEDCQGNESDGIIPIDDDFSSGDSEPPGHPNCRCAIAPARLDRYD